MCPVDDTGKNSVSPSIIARIMTWKMFICVVELIELDWVDKLDLVD